MVWFLACVGRAIDGAKTTLAPVFTKARFWKGVEGVPLNDRQRRLLNRLMDDFSGRLTTSKWAKLAKCSQDTALRDITGLVNHGILVRNPEGGRSTSLRPGPSLAVRAFLGRTHNAMPVKRTVVSYYSK